MSKITGDLESDKSVNNMSCYSPESTKFTIMLQEVLNTPIDDRRNTLFTQLLKKFINNGDSALPVKSILASKSDYETYQIIHAHCHLNENKFNISSIGNESNHRAINRANEIYEIFHKFDITTSGGNYLDYGCSNGTLTTAIGKRLDTYTYGCDVHKWHGIDNKCCDNNVKYYYLQEDGLLPVDLSIKFNIVTAFMVLHHLPQDRLSAVIKDLVSRINTNGHFILREHDANCEQTIDYCHFEHALYDLVTPKEQFTKFYDEYIGNYYSSDYWGGLLCEAGLELIYTTKAWGATRYTYMLFKKTTKD